jgi:hypothetical protein
MSEGMESWADLMDVRRVLAAAPAVEPTGPARPLIDADGRLRDVLPAPGPFSYLIRPDGYLAARGRGSDPRRLLAFLERIGLRPRAGRTPEVRGSVGP